MFKCKLMRRLYWRARIPTSKYTFGTDGRDKMVLPMMGWPNRVLVGWIEFENVGFCVDSIVLFG